MKSLFYLGPGKLELKEVKEPDSEGNEVIIKVLEAGICGTDVKAFQFGHHLFKPPTILGHECYGIVVKKPSFIKHVDIGDYVAVAPYGECGVCEECRKGIPELCKNKTFITSGCFTQYLAVPPEHSFRGLFKVINPGSHMVLAEPLACVIGSVRKFGIPARALIVGGGVMGTLFAMYMTKRGCDVQIVELSEWRIKFLRNMGINVINSVDVEKKAYGIVIIAATFKEAMEYLDAVEDGGQFVLFGGYPKDTQLVFNPFHVHYREIIVSGSFGYSLPDFAEALEELSSDSKRYAKIITHSYPISEYEKAFERAISKKSLKITLRMW